MIIVALVLCSLSVGAVNNIMDFRAIPNNTSTEACQANSQALTKAFESAKNTGEVEILIPSGSDFYFFPVKLSSGKKMVFTIDGNIYASSDYQNWPVSDDLNFDNLIDLSDFNSLTIRGKGAVDG